MSEWEGSITGNVLIGTVRALAMINRKVIEAPNIKAPKTEIKGFFTFQPCTYTRQWCPDCTKSRTQEVCLGEMMCVICGFRSEAEIKVPIDEEEQPGFQIERFIKGE